MPTITNKEKKLQRRGVLIGLFILLCGFAFAANVFYHTFFLRPRLMAVDNLIATYIAENDGMFPSSRKELADKLYIKLNPDGSYSIRSSLREGEWENMHLDMDLFTIQYGIKIEQLELDDGSVVDSSTGALIYLISGPLNFPWRPGSLRRAYQSVSSHWYEAMVEHTESS